MSADNRPVNRSAVLNTLALDEWCPSCGAPPGGRCRALTIIGGDTTLPHPSRVERARERR